MYYLAAAGPPEPGRPAAHRARTGRLRACPVVAQLALAISVAQDPGHLALGPLSEYSVAVVIPGDARLRVD